MEHSLLNDPSFSSSSLLRSKQQRNTVDPKAMYFLNEPIHTLSSSLSETVKSFALSLCESDDLYFAERVLRDIARGRHAEKVINDTYFWILRSEIYEKMHRLKLAEACFERAEELKCEPSRLLYECWAAFHDRHGSLLSDPLLHSHPGMMIIKESDEEHLDAIVTSVLTEMSTPDPFSSDSTSSTSMNGLLQSSSSSATPLSLEDQRVSTLITSMVGSTDEDIHHTIDSDIDDDESVSDEHFGRTLMSSTTPTAVRYSIFRTDSKSDYGGSSLIEEQKKALVSSDARMIKTHGSLTLTEVRHYEDEPIESGKVVDIVCSAASIDRSDPGNPASLRRHDSAYRGRSQELWISESEDNEDLLSQTESDWDSIEEEDQAYESGPTGSSLSSLKKKKKEEEDPESHTVSAHHSSELDTQEMMSNVNDHYLSADANGGSASASELCSDSIRESESESVYHVGPSSEELNVQINHTKPSSSESSSIDITGYSSVSSSAAMVTAEEESTAMADAHPPPTLRHVNSYIDESLLDSIRDSMDRDDTSFKMSTLLRRTSVRDQFKGEECGTPDVSPSKLASFSSFSSQTTYSDQRSPATKIDSGEATTDLYGDSTWFGD